MPLHLESHHAAFGNPLTAPTFATGLLFRSHCEMKTFSKKGACSKVFSLMRARINGVIYDYIEKYYSDKMDLEKMKSILVSELKRFYGKDTIFDVLYAFYYIRPAG